VTHDVNDYYSVINGSMGCHSDELGTQEIRARKCGTWVSRKLLSTKTSEIAQLLLLTNMEAVKQYLLPVVTSAILTATGLALWQSSKRFVPKEKQRGTFGVQMQEYVHKSASNLKIIISNYLAFK
jgi:hypothetical protein